MVATKARFNRKAVINGREWSEYQRALFDFCLNGSGHGLVEAVAGSGKSSSIVGAIAHLPSDKKIAVVAFNNHSVEELASKLPTSVSVSTAHKFGLSALVRYFSGQVFRPNDEKYRGLSHRAIEALVKELGASMRGVSEDLDLFIAGVDSKDRKIQRTAKALRRNAARYLESIIHYGMATLSDWSLASLLAMDEHFCIEKDFPVELVEAFLKFVPRVVDRGYDLALSQQDISLDELLYLPVKLGLSFPAYDFVFFDECQDASKLMQAMASLMTNSGRLVAVGDSFQAIQGFTGASSESMREIEYRFQPKRLPLSVCYRCPSSHLDLARCFSPETKNRPDAPKGTIQVIHPSGVLKVIQSGDLLICRFTAPLVQVCLALVANGKKAMVRGRDIGAQIVGLADSIRCQFPEGFREALTAKIEPALKDLRSSDKDAEAQALEDRYMAVSACFDSFGRDCSTVGQFADRIQSLFCDDSEHPPITLATIHRSKGDESDRVFILGSNFLPYEEKAQHDWQIQQEHNLTYVALTRSKADLFLVPWGKEKQIEKGMRHPLGGLTLPAEVVETPKLKENTLLLIPVKRQKLNNGVPDHTYSLPANPEPIYAVGDWVALHLNPLNAHKIIAIGQNEITVQRGKKDPVSVGYASVKPLIPIQAQNVAIALSDRAKVE